MPATTRLFSAVPAGGAVALGTGISAGGLTFNGAGYSITGNTLTLAAGANVTTASDATITSTLAGTTFNKLGSGKLTIGDGTNGSYAGNIALSAGTVEFRTAGTSFANAFSGTGTVIFTGANTGAASGSVSSFTLSGANTGLTGTASIVANNSRLVLDAVADTGTAALSNTGNGQFYLTNNVTYANNFTLQGIGWGEDAGNLGAMRLGGATVSGNVTLAANTRIGAYGSTGTISGVISGASALEIGSGAGGGTVTLIGANTFTGGTTVTSGTLQLGNANGTDYGATGRLRGAVTVASGATLLLSGSNTLGYNAGSKVDAIAINGGTLTHAGNGDNGWGVAYTLTGGTMQTTGSGQFSFGNVTTVTTLASATTSTIAGKVMLREANTGDVVLFTVADGAAATDLLVSASISQNSAGYGVTKAGAGTMLLTGANTYSGATLVSAGTLALGATGTLATSAVTVNTGATFRVDAAGKTLSALTLNDGAILAISAQSGQTTTVTGALTFGAGATSITINPIVTGALAVNDVVNLVTAGSVVNAPGSGVLQTTVTGSRITGTTAVSGNLLQFTVATAGANLVWTNGTANNTWNTVDNNFSNGGSPDKFYTYDNVTFNDTSGTGAKTVTLSGNLSAGSIVVNNTTGNDFTFANSASNVIAGGALTKSGTGTLTLTGTAANTYTGGTVINGGTVALGTGGTGGNTSSVNALGTGAVTVNTGGTLKLWIQNSNSFTFANAVTLNGGTLLGQDGIYNLTGLLTAGAGGGTVQSVWGGKFVTLSGGLAGSGALTFNSPDQVLLTKSNGTAYTGNMTVSGGALSFNMSPGNGGSYALTTGTLTMNSGRLLNLTQTEANGYGAANVFNLGSSVILAGNNQVYAAGTTGAQLMTITSGWQVNGAATINNATYAFNASGTGTAGTSSYAQFLDLTGVVSGTGALTLNRQSTESYIRMTGSTSGYSGAVTVGGGGATGYVIFGNAAGWGSGSLTLAGTNAKAVVGDVAPTAFNGGWTGGGAAGLTSGTVTAAGAITVGAGTTLSLLNGSGNAISLVTQGAVAVNGGTLGNQGTGGTSAFVPFTNTTWTFGGTAASTVAANVRLDYAGVTFAVGSTGAATDTTVSGVISGVNGLIKSGSGTLTLSGANTYSGNTTITAGTVAVTSAGQLLMKIMNGGVSNGVTVSAGAVLAMDGVLAIDVTGLTDGSGSWTLITGTGSKNYTGNFSVKNSTGAAFANNSGLWTLGNLSFDQNTGILTAVPEPSTYGLLGAGALAAAALVRRRRRAA